MMIVPAGVKVHLALGYTDMRKGMDGLAMLVQDMLKKDAFSGHPFAFRGKRARIIKILFWDATRQCTHAAKAMSRRTIHPCSRACVRLRTLNFRYLSCVIPEQPPSDGSSKCPDSS
jgi:transposase